MTAALSVLTEGRPVWQEQALCAQVDWEIFFPDKGCGNREAKKVCAACPVRAECLQHALDHDERFGVWGGLSERERRQLRDGTAAERGRARADQDERILALAREGLTAPVIAERLSLRGPHVVYDTKRRHGITSPRALAALPTAPPARAPGETQPAPARSAPAETAPPPPTPENVRTGALEPKRPSRRWHPDELRIAIRTLEVAGLPTADIASELGVTVHTVRRCRP